MPDWTIAPPGQEGWLRHKKKSRSNLSGADGVVVQATADRIMPTT